MPYTDHFQHADDVVAHLNGIVPKILDPLLQTKYVGFVSIAAVTVFELAIKYIFIDFSSRKNKVFGIFTKNYFNRINGKIKIQIIKEDYIKKFCDKYLQRFNKKIDNATKNYLSINRRDIVNSYQNLIQWRNNFAHEGNINATATYNEAVLAYQDGKEVVRCLAESMTR